MKNVLKKVASKLPIFLQQQLKRYYFAYQIKNNMFMTNEKEYYCLERWVSKGDWVIDIGANIGHYTIKLSNIVGKQGRVIAFEPIPETFELLSANVSFSKNKNVTLLNMCASDSTQILGMNIPRFNTGLNNYYEAHVTKEDSDIQVLCFPIDMLNLKNEIKLIKIDAEGHDLEVLIGAKKILKTYHPILIIEDNSSDIANYLKPFDYKLEKKGDSTNCVYL